MQNPEDKDGRAPHRPWRRQATHLREHTGLQPVMKPLLADALRLGLHCTRAPARHLHAVAGIGSCGSEWAPLDTNLTTRAPRGVRCHARVIFAFISSATLAWAATSSAVAWSDSAIGSSVVQAAMSDFTRRYRATWSRRFAWPHCCARPTMSNRSLRDGPASAQHLLKGTRARCGIRYAEHARHQPCSQTGPQPPTANSHRELTHASADGTSTAYARHVHGRIRCAGQAYACPASQAAQPAPGPQTWPHAGPAWNRNAPP